MTDYLVFQLYGPMASWGQPAVGGDRATAMSPTRSAILGLLGAALGIRRDEEGCLDTLHQSVRVATKQLTPSSLLRDYHTSQVPARNNKYVYRTRKNELLDEQKNKLNTVLSTRDYRCDGLWVVALSLTEKASMTLEMLQQALQRPVFVLYLGRKSCPISAPLLPTLVPKSGLKEALDYEFPKLLPEGVNDSTWLRRSRAFTYTWEGEINEISGDTVMTTHPWDDPVSRSRWQFQQRAMYQVTIHHQETIREE